MPDNPTFELSRLLEETIHRTEGNKISMNLLIGQLGTRAYGILLILLALPNAIPVAGMLGISLLTGFLMLIFSAQIACAMEKPWLPRFVAKKEIPKEILLKSVTIAKPYLQKIEPFIRPRILALSTPAALQITGVIIGGFCLIMLLPLPFGNFGPALAIFLIGLGMLEKDGLCIAVGTLVGILYCAVLFWFTLGIMRGILSVFFL